jgi:SAM-dependent MidA family methyltransferase
VQKRAPEFFEALRYQIVEPLPILKERQSRTLELFGDKIEWRDSLQPFVGVHFSNELLDAMPARLIGGGRERFVGLDGEKFVFVDRPVHDEANFNQAALDWIDSVATNLQRGYVITIDYGHSGGEFHGNIQVRAQHRNLDSPFEQIGHADITIGVDWTSVADWAQSNGMRVAGFTDQHHFLTGLISESPDLTPESGAKIKRELQTLLHPEMLGRAFQALALAKNVDLNAPPLAGFKFAGEADAALALIDPGR